MTLLTLATTPVQFGAGGSRTWRRGCQWQLKQLAGQGCLSRLRAVHLFKCVHSCSSGAQRCRQVQLPLARAPHGRPLTSKFTVVVDTWPSSLTVSSATHERLAAGGDMSMLNEGPRPLVTLAVVPLVEKETTSAPPAGGHVTCQEMVQGGTPHWLPDASRMTGVPATADSGEALATAMASGMSTWRAWLVCVCWRKCGTRDHAHKTLQLCAL